MARARRSRTDQRQLGQFITPSALAGGIVASLELDVNTRILEPSFGDGSFILPLVERLMGLYEGTDQQRLELVLSRNIFGVELDAGMHSRCLDRIEDRWGGIPASHNLVRGDFFRHDFGRSFDFIVGNPPFGGTFDAEIEDILDRRYGIWNGYKIKKETYAFFIVRSLEMLRHGGSMQFICSDSFLTIPTMRGLRRLLMEHGTVVIERLVKFSPETSYPMVVLQFVKDGKSDLAIIEEAPMKRHLMELTGNFS